MNTKFINWTTQMICVNIDIRSTFGLTQKIVVVSCVFMCTPSYVCVRREKHCMPAEDSAGSAVDSRTQSVCPCCVRSHLTPPFPTPCRGL